MKSRRVIRLACLALIVACGSTAFGQKKAPNVNLTLVSSVSAAAPGEPFELGLKFELPDGFHIYWENPGDSGLAPKAAWKLPPGFKAGPLRFPTPTRHEASGLVTNVLKGSPILLTTITPAKDVEVGSTANIEADVSWLVCKESCFRGSKTVSISVPTASATKPLEDDLTFKMAHRVMPVPAGKASCVTIKPSSTKAETQKGDTFEVTLEVDIKDGFHTQSNKPLAEFFVPTEVFVRTVEGFEYDQPVWPEPHLRTDKTFGKLSEFVDKFKVRIPVKHLAPTRTGNVQISGLLKYQACNEQGRCFTPQAVEWSANVQSQTVLSSVTETQTDAVTDVAAVPADSVVADSGEPAASAGEVNRADDSTPAKPTPAKPISAKTNSTADNGWISRWGIWGAILGGLLGGLILNVMPCVLPVISIKILSFVQQVDEDPRRVFHLGLMFCLGIIVSFWALAGGIIGLRELSGQQAGWGAFFQQPQFIIAMSALMFAFALSLFGVFEVSLPGTATTKLAGATEREGLTGAFMKGVLATLLATPCTAPFLGPAIAFALTNSVFTVAIIFTAVGFGMALPYLILTANPGWLKYLPRPGAWMNTFKQFMGFLLMGTVVWLVWIYAGLTSSDEVIMLLLFLCLLAVGCWLYGKTNPMWNVPGKLAMTVFAFAVVVGGTWYSFFYTPPALQWVKYTQGRAESLAAEGYTVYVDYTARWCATCQTNKSVVLHSTPVLRRFDSDKTVAIKADYTNPNPEISEDLLRFGRDGVPLNIVYPAGRPDEPIVLPTILTKSIVLEALRKAGPSTADAPFSDDTVASAD